MKNAIILVIVLTIVSCWENIEKEEVMHTQDYLNLTLILDLSDRIKSDNQRQKDKMIIEELLTVFQERQKQFMFQLSKDRFSIAVADQKGVDLNLFGLGEDLHIDMSESGMNKPEFDRRRERFLVALDSLYQSAEVGPTPGADIWTFFRDKLPMYLARSKDKVIFHNKLVILSDGYLHFDRAISSNRQAGTFMKNLAHLRNKIGWVQIFEEQNFCMEVARSPDTTKIEVLMLEVAPESPEVNTNEMDILRKFWGCWFDTMAIRYQLYPKEDNPANLKKLVQAYVEVERRVVGVKDMK